MKQQTFEKRYDQSWKELDAILVECERPSVAFWRTVNLNGDLPQMYRRVCHHLSLARQRRYSNHLVMKLNDLVLRSHQQLYRRRSRFLHQFLRFVIHTFPAKVREHIRYFWIANIIFYGPAIVIFALVLLKPELIYNVFDYSYVARFEDMYDPSAEKFGQDRDAQSDVQMFGVYIQNNISIGFQTFATGIVAGLGSLFYMAYNGLVFGALSAHMVNIDYEAPFFSFVIAHGSFELTAIVIAGMGGLMLGHSLIAPGRRTRLEALRHTGKQTLPLLYGIIFLLVIAAFFEAFWSSNRAIPLAIKYGVGAAFWALVFAYLAFSGRNRQSGER